MRLTLLLLLTSLGLFAQEDFTTTSSLFGDLRARQIGPAVMSGRISCLAVHPADAATVYIGAAGGGVWKTSSAGARLAPIFDDHTQSIGAIALAPSNPEVVYVGTGEPWPRNSVSVGTGVYRSVDGGNRWASLGLEGTERIADIVVHPKDPDVVYVAALGPLWNSGEERGVFKSTDGGKTWAKVLYLDENTGAANLSLDPNNPDVLYAAMWSFRRSPHSFDSGLNGKSGLYKTTDGGDNWTELRNGFPEGKFGRIGVAIASSNSDTVYASLETGVDSTSGVYLSGDAGASWTHRSSAINTRIRPFYFSELTVDPSDASIVAKCGREGIISQDAGNRWTNFDGFVHSDFHAIWIDPADGKHILVGTDGGVYESRDRGNTFKMWMNLPVSQFYHVSVDNAKPYRVYGGLQDNGSWFAPNRSSGGVSNADWEKTFGGDGFYSFRHPTKDNYVFSEYQGGNLVRYDTETGVAKNIAPYATADTDPLRFNWNAPIHLSQDGQRTYFASQYLFRSNNEGDSWVRISPDLTTNDKSKQQQATSGGLTIDNSTAENYTTIYAVAESPVDKNTIWVGTDDGNLQVTTDAGKTWTKLNDNLPDDLPQGNWITFVEPSPHDANTAFVAFDGHRTGDMATYLCKTTDGGKTWTRLHGDALEGYALSVRQDLVNPSLLFLGTEFGLYISLDGGSSWAPFRNNLPMVGIRDMVIHPRESDLVLGTHGRGIIIIDDLEALRQITPEITSQKVAFLEPKPAFLPDPSGFGNGNFGGSGNYVGSNPTTSAEIMYYAGSRHTFGKMYIEVYKDGEKIRELPAGKSKGLNIVRMPTTLERPKAAPSDNRNALVGGSRPPQLAPGTYQVKLIKGRNTYETEFTITTDPESPYTPADRAAQREAVMKLFSDTEELAYIYEVLDQIEQQAASIQQKSTKKRIDEMASSVKEMAGKEKSQLAFRGGDFYVNEGSMLREEMGNLYYSVSSFPGRPSDSQLQEAERIHKVLVAVHEKLDQFLANDVAKLNSKLGETAQITWPTMEVFLATEDDISGK